MKACGLASTDLTVSAGVAASVQLSSETLLAHACEVPAPNEKINASAAKISLIGEMRAACIPDGYRISVNFPLTVKSDEVDILFERL